MMRKHALLLLISLLLIGTVAAFPQDYNEIVCGEGTEITFNTDTADLDLRSPVNGTQYVIYYLTFNPHVGQKIDYTLTFVDGSIKTGYIWWHDGILLTSIDICFDGVCQNNNNILTIPWFTGEPYFWDTNDGNYHIVMAREDDETGQYGYMLFYDSWMGRDDFFVFQEDPYPDPITRAVFTVNTGEIQGSYAYGDVNDFGEEGFSLTKMVNLVKEVGAFVWWLTTGGWYIYVSYFISNILLFIGLYFLITGAVAANKAGTDIFKFLKLWYENLEKGAKILTKFFTWMIDLFRNIKEIVWPF